MQNKNKEFEKKEIWKSIEILNKSNKKFKIEENIFKENNKLVEHSKRKVKNNIKIVTTNNSYYANDNIT